MHAIDQELLTFCGLDPHALGFHRFIPPAGLSPAEFMTLPIDSYLTETTYPRLALLGVLLRYDSIPRPTLERIALGGAELLLPVFERVNRRTPVLRRAIHRKIAFLEERAYNDEGKVTAADLELLRQDILLIIEDIGRQYRQAVTSSLRYRRKLSFRYSLAEKIAFLTLIVVARDFYVLTPAIKRKEVASLNAGSSGGGETPRESPWFEYWEGIVQFPNLAKLGLAPAKGIDRLWDLTFLELKKRGT